MATAEQITELRRLIDQPDNVEPWTDTYLGTRIDAHEGELSTLAATMWREKAASYAGMVDIQEGNSNRKLSQLYKQALEMANGLGGAELGVTRKPTRTRPIERQ